MATDQARLLITFSSASVPLGGGVRYPRPLASPVLRGEMKISVYVGCDGDSFPVGLSRGSAAGTDNLLKHLKIIWRP